MPVTEQFIIAPGPKGDAFVRLARSKTGTTFRKQILKKGPLRHPATGDIITVDDQYAETMVKNFEAGYCDIVQVPLADDNNSHSEAPDRNIGEVIGLEHDAKGVYAIVDIRKHADEVGKTLLGISAMFDQNYTDTATGAKVGPTLLHTCVTNRPYVTGLEDFSQVVAATADTSQGNKVCLTDPSETETTKVDIAEIIKALKDEHKIEVTAEQLAAIAGFKDVDLTKITPEQIASLKDPAAVTAAADAAKEAGKQELVAALTKAMSDAGIIKLSAETKVSPDQTVQLITTLSTGMTALTAEVATLKAEKVTAEVDALVKTGHILPAQRDNMIKLANTNRELFDGLVPAEPVVKLSAGAGFELPDVPGAEVSDVDAEVKRLTEQYAAPAAKK